MANPITTTAAFATANMKPAPDEQTDALWGQNMADNAGYVFFRQQRLQPSAFTNNSDIFIFQKQAEFNGLKLVVEQQTGSAAVVQYMRVFGQGTNFLNTSGGSLSATQSYNQTALSFNRFDMDISALTNGSYYGFQWNHTAAPDTGYAAVWMTYGSGATY